MSKPATGRDAILEAASLAFAERGYDAASVGEIAAAAGVTKPMVYYYFGSKDGLYGAVLEAALAALHQALPPPRSTRGQAGRLREVMRALARLSPRARRLLQGAGPHHRPPASQAALAALGDGIAAHLPPDRRTAGRWLLGGALQLCLSAPADAAVIERAAALLEEALFEA